MALKAYMGWSGPDTEDGACLIFAHSVKEAKPLAHACMTCWYDGVDWIDVRIRWLKDSKHLFKQANQEKLKAGEAHYIESPGTCERCELWGGEQNDNGSCTHCEDLDPC